MPNQSMNPSTNENTSQYEQGSFRLLRCLLPEDGPGSLNRFFLGPKRVYETVCHRSYGTDGSDCIHHWVELT